MAETAPMKVYQGSKQMRRLSGKKRKTVAAKSKRPRVTVSQTGFGGAELT